MSDPLPADYQPAPHVPEPKPAEFPKWIEPHASHLKDNGAGFPVAALFPHLEVERGTGRVKVLVKDEDEEKAALAEFSHADKA